MDWGAIASVLAERCEQPIALLDKDGLIQLLNSAMEQVLGRTRFQVEGQPWAKVCTPPDHQTEARRWITEALRGALRSYEAVGVTSGGERISFRFEFSLVGRGLTQGLLMTATHAAPAASSVGPLAGQDLDYDVTSSVPGFGALSRIVASGETIQIDHADARCFAVIHGIQQPCPDCPLVGDAESPWPRISVRHSTRNGTAGVFEVKTAEKIAEHRVRVRLRLLPERTLEAIHAAKVDELASRAALSPREREILSHLLLGRHVEDIAKVVGIAARTVKFHQTNVLEKLGADSRADLLRLLF
jgi:PAS domain S-box-containing protein